MDAKNKRLVIVGIFTSVLTALLALSIIIIGGNQMFLASRYSLLTNFKDAQGLYEGSIVSLAGVQIGNVIKISIHPQDSSVLVKLSIDKSYSQRITSESVAAVKTMGVLGDKYIYIEPSSTGNSLDDGDILAVALQKDFLSALNSRSDDLAHLGEILKESSDLLKVFNNQNRAALLMENLTNTSKNLNELTGRKEASEAIIRFARILKKIDTGEGTLGRLINDPSLYDRMMDLTGASSRKRFLKPLIQNSLESYPGTASGN